jgi:guanylate kinase
MTQNCTHPRTGPGSLFVIAAPSGAGKTTLTRLAMAQNPRLALSISTTTRAPRPGEQDGVHYHFVTVEVFRQMQAAGAFLEWAEVHSNFYGTTRSGIEALLREDRDVILEIDWQGAAQVQKLMPAALSIFILPPSRDTLLQRLTTRGQDGPEVISKRMAEATNEMSHFGQADYLVINDHFATALDDLKAIFRSNLLKRDVQQARNTALLAGLLAQ